MSAPSLHDRITGSGPIRRRQAVGRTLLPLLARLDVDGLERIPAQGPVLLASNHSAFLDGPVLFGLVPRPVSFVVKSEAFVPGMAQLFLLPSGQLPVSRDRLDPAPIRAALRILDAGGVVGMFPEGSRGDGAVREAKPGVGYLAVKTGATVIPVACHGTLNIAHRRTARRPDVRIVFGEPLLVEPAATPAHRSVWILEAERIRIALAGLVAKTAP